MEGTILCRLHKDKLFSFLFLYSTSILSVNTRKHLIPKTSLFTCFVFANCCCGIIKQISLTMNAFILVWLAASQTPCYICLHKKPLIYNLFRNIYINNLYILTHETSVVTFILYCILYPSNSNNMQIASTQ